MTATTSPETLHRLARPTGTLAMVAMDQRESLRAMLAEHHAGPVGDEALRAFKVTVAREVGRYASGFLIDRWFAYDDVIEQSLLPGSCGLILAVDDLRHDGPVVVDTGIDRAIDPVAARAQGVAALKLLVVWRRDERREQRVAMAAEFIELCASVGLCSVLEPVARPAVDEAGDFDLDAAILEAAGELGPLRPTLYKAQVPGMGRGPDVGAVCERLTETVPVPWVALSQGVALDDFPNAVEIACRSGASGFLAGRAIWSDTVGATDPGDMIRQRSVDRLRRLGDTVDRYARPWHTV